MTPKVNIIKRIKGLFIKSFKVFVLIVLSCLFDLSGLTAQSTRTASETVTVGAVVISHTVSPATPPPTPSVNTNNGVPLTIESGTDRAIFKGRAYPGSTISLLKNGLVLNELPAKEDGTFEVPVYNILPGTYTFSLLAKDSSGLKSSMVTYTIIITSNVVTEVKGIILPPTITTDKSEVKFGDNIIFSGRGIPDSEVFLTIFAKSGVTRTINTDASGVWSYTLTTKGLDLSDYNAKARTKIENTFTLYSDTILFTVGTSNKIRKSGVSLISARCDLNNDSRVNLLDFSIMAFWYKRLGFPMKVDLNSDNRINLTDLSILAYCWTG